MEELWQEQTSPNKNVNEAWPFGEVGTLGVQSALKVKDDDDNDNDNNKNNNNNNNNYSRLLKQGHIQGQPMTGYHPSGGRTIRRADGRKLL